MTNTMPSHLRVLLPIWPSHLLVDFLYYLPQNTHPCCLKVAILWPFPVLSYACMQLMLNWHDLKLNSVYTPTQMITYQVSLPLFVHVNESYMFTCLYLYIYIYIYTHTHTHTPVLIIKNIDLDPFMLFGWRDLSYNEGLTGSLPRPIGNLAKLTSL